VSERVSELSEREEEKATRSQSRKQMTGSPGYLTLTPPIQLTREPGRDFVGLVSMRGRRSDSRSNYYKCGRSR
jgi:hypothetical protein